MHNKLRKTAPIAIPPGQETSWCHLVPVDVVVTRERQGRRYTYTIDAAAIDRLVAAFDPADPQLVDREHYSLDPSHGDTRAMGWIEALEKRPDGIWGLIRWTPAGSAMVTNRELRMLSPVFDMSKDDMPVRLSGAALTNTPFFRKQLVPVANKAATGDQGDTPPPVGVAKENPHMDKIKELLGLPPEADDEAVAAKVAELIAAANAAQEAAATAEANKAWDDHKDLFKGETKASFLELYKAAPKTVAAIVGAVVRKPVVEAAKAVTPSFRTTPAQPITRDAFKAGLAAQPPAKRQAWYDDHVGRVIDAD